MSRLSLSARRFLSHDDGAATASVGWQLMLVAVLGMMALMLYGGKLALLFLDQASPI